MIRMRLNEQNTKEINSNDQGGMTDFQPVERSQKRYDIKELLGVNNMMQMLIPKTVRYRSERLVISRKEDEVGQAIITMDE